MLVKGAPAVWVEQDDPCTRWFLGKITIVQNIVFMVHDLWKRAREYAHKSVIGSKSTLDQVIVLYHRALNYFLIQRWLCKCSTIKQLRIISVNFCILNPNNTIVRFILISLLWTVWWRLDTHVQFQCLFPIENILPSLRFHQQLNIFLLFNFTFSKYLDYWHISR